ncbi:MAG TPA: hypothetical protein VGS18_04410, partial [Thermoplasmata archaeon]|nr:hypothetical protein [Thermoplasmata archaeon]
ILVTTGLIALSLGTSVTLSSAPPRAQLAASPPNVGAPGDAAGANTTCPFSAGSWTCTLVLGETSSSNRAATWTASSPARASFTPHGGLLHPGGSVRVTVVISSCGGSYALNFVGPQNTATVTFSCG